MLEKRYCWCWGGDQEIGEVGKRGERGCGSLENECCGGIAKC